MRSKRSDRMKAKVKRSYTHERKEFVKGELLDIKDDAVFYKGEWLCDVGSPLFNVMFVLVND